MTTPATTCQGRIELQVAASTTRSNTNNNVRSEEEVAVAVAEGTMVEHLHQDNPVPAVEDQEEGGGMNLTTGAVTRTSTAGRSSTFAAAQLHSSNSVIGAGAWLQTQRSTVTSTSLHKLGPDVGTRRVRLTAVVVPTTRMEVMVHMTPHANASSSSSNNNNNNNNDNNNNNLHSWLLLVLRRGVPRTR